MNRLFYYYNFVKFKILLSLGWTIFEPNTFHKYEEKKNCVLLKLKFFGLKCGVHKVFSVECEIKQRNVNAFSYFSSYSRSGSKIHSNSDSKRNGKEQWSTHFTYECAYGIWNATLAIRYVAVFHYCFFVFSSFSSYHDSA